MPKSRIGPNAVRVEGREVFKWPEFMALANRLGIDLASPTRSLTICLEVGALVTLTENFFADDQGPTSGPRETNTLHNTEWATAQPPKPLPVKWFPILTERAYKKPFPRMVPWHIAELAYGPYSSKYGNNQSLERLAERGGFDPGEMDEYYPGWLESWEKYKCAALVKDDLVDALKTLIRSHDEGYLPLTADLDKAREAVARV